jgi:hypothetical protein
MRPSDEPSKRTGSQPGPGEKAKVVTAVASFVGNPSSSLTSPRRRFKINHSKTGMMVDSNSN